MEQWLNKWNLSNFFEKGKNGKYSNQACLSQDLLRYHSIINQTHLQNNSFKFNKLLEWIVLNNNEITDEYQGSKSHTTLSNKKHAHEERVKHFFQGLINLNLIRQSGTTHAKKLSNLEIPTYEYTKSGIFLVLIIKSMNLTNVIAITKKENTFVELKKQLDNVHSEIYEVFNLAYKINQDSPASDIFYSIYFQKSKDKQLFDKLVNRIQFILNWDHGIRSVPDLLERAIYDPFFEKRPRSDFTNLFYESIEGLDQENQKLILYEIKILAEGKFKGKLEEMTHLTRPYEEFRFNLRGDYKRFAFEGYCKNCKSSRPVALNYLDLKTLSVANEKRADCPICNTKRSLLINNF
jgi:hypothetical protein